MPAEEGEGIRVAALHEQREVGGQVRRSSAHKRSSVRKNHPPSIVIDSSLSPALETDGQNPARERAEALIRKILDATDLAEASGG
jgi:hypothetical protein